MVGACQRGGGQVVGVPGVAAGVFWRCLCEMWLVWDQGMRPMLWFWRCLCILGGMEMCLGSGDERGERLDEMR